MDVILKCAVCGRGMSAGKMCLFKKFFNHDGPLVAIHPKCGKDPSHPLHILSTSGLRERFGSSPGFENAYLWGVFATGPRFGNCTQMYIVADIVAYLEKEGILSAIAEKKEKRKKTSNPYLMRVLEGTVATSRGVKGAGSPQQRLLINGDCVHFVKKTCRAYKVEIIVVDPTKRGCGRPV